jgi:hypothetical protein
MLIFRRIFLSNYWWQKFDIWSQASYRYPISWEAFFDPSDSYILFAEDRGYHRWALAHSSSCLLLVRTLYGVTKFMICYWSVHCMLRSSLWFVTGQNVVCYDQVYDLLLVSTLYVMTKFMICCWSEHCMLRPSLWFVAGQNVVCYDQVYHLLLVRTLYATTKLMIIPPLSEVGGGYTVLPPSVRPGIFFVTFFSLTVDGRNLIFGQKHHIGIPYCG